MVNRPQSLRDCNEVLRHSVPAVHTADLGRRRSDILREFANEHRDIILKPTDEMGGAWIFRHRGATPICP